jgi:hypothetical protein
MHDTFGPRPQLMSGVEVTEGWVRGWWTVERNGRQIGVITQDGPGRFAVTVAGKRLGTTAMLHSAARWIARATRKRCR